MDTITSDRPRPDNHAHELADAMPIIVWTHDADGVAHYFNRRWTEYTGLTAADTVRVGPVALVHPDDRARVVKEFEDARRSGRPFTTSYRLRHRDGGYRWHDARVQPIFGARPAGAALWVGTAIDIDDQRRAYEEQTNLVKATAVLGSSLDLQRTLSQVTALVVPTLADWAAVDLLRDDHALERLAVAHVDPSKVKLAWELWERTPPDPSDAHGAFQAIRTRAAELLATIDDGLLSMAVRDPRTLEILRGLGLRSSICAPLIARDRVLGVLTLVTAESGKSYAARDVAFAEELARRMAIAIDNARLYEEATRARAAAEALAADVVEQSKAVEAELLKMRAERDEARRENAALRGEGGDDSAPAS